MTQPEILDATAQNNMALTKDLMRVPLSKLLPSRSHVCKTTGRSIDALAASIQRVG